MLQFSQANRAEKEQAAIERRRQREEERKQRIFNPKARSMGVDVDGLEQQVQEKTMMKDEEKLRDQYYEEQLMLATKTAMITEKRIQDVRKQKLAEMNDFRKNYQNPQQRREFDLSNPNALKEEKPARVGDYDSRLGVSSLQKFHGEDLQFKERAKAQQQQLKTWIQEQSTEKQNIKQNEENEKKLEELRQAELAAYAAELERQQQLIRAEKLRAVKEFNLEQAKTKKQDDLLKRLQEEEDKLEEIQNQINSDLLTENFAATINVNDPSRFKKYHFKALRPDQYEKIMQERQYQLDEKRKILEQERQEEEATLLEQKLLLRKALELERERARQRKLQNQELFNTHRQQALEAKDKDNFMKQVYENRVTEDFFSQFNTSSR